jgi:hypothetical protein
MTAQSRAQQSAGAGPRETDEEGSREAHHHELQDEKERAELAEHGMRPLLRRRIVRSRGER